jgi:hypothetical protein
MFVEEHQATDMRRPSPPGVGVHLSAASGHQLCRHNLAKGGVGLTVSAAGQSSD